jgi:hypothetical protein
MSSPKQWWRWLASLVIVDSAPHMAVTLGLFAVLGLHLEPRYGTVRIALLSLIAGLGGNFFDGATLVRNPLTNGICCCQECVMKGRPHAVGNERTEGGRDGESQGKEGEKPGCGCGRVCVCMSACMCLS